MSFDKKEKKWTPIIQFQLVGADFLDSLKNSIIRGTFTDKDGKAGKSVSCKTGVNGRCSVSGKGMKTSNKGGIDYSDFVLVSLSSGKTVVNPRFELTVTWK